MKVDAADPNFNEEEYRKVLKTRNQNMVKLQRYRVAKQIEKMQPTIHFMEEGRKNEQVIFAENEQDLARIVEETKRKRHEAEDDDAVLGKRSLIEDVDDHNEGERLLHRSRN